MDAASSNLRVNSYPAMLTQIGSPIGALKFNRTATPGKKPISKNLFEKSSERNPAIIAVSPGAIWAILRD